MAIMNDKKGFVFTFLALFIVIVIYLFAQINLDSKTYSLQNEFEESRIKSIDRELEYFKSSYLKESLSISFKETITHLLNKSQDSSFYNTYSNNYSKFNKLIKEGMINGSFNGVSQSPLENITISKLVNEFKKTYENTQKTQFNFSLRSIAVYEETPYHLSLQANYFTSSKATDDLGTWKTNETIIVEEPLYNNYEPHHLLTFNLGNNSPRLTTVENRYTSNVNWSLSVFNNTINNQLTTTYTDSDYKYTLGMSFLDGLFKQRSGSYKNTNGFWSFDYDLEEGGVYDTSQTIDLGEYFGYSKLLYDFQATNSTHVNNSADYQYDGKLYGGINCSANGVDEEGCRLDGIDDYIVAEQIPFGKTDNSSFSYSIWIKTNVSGSQQTLIGKTNNAFENGSGDSNIHLFMNSSGTPGWKLEYNGSNNPDVFLMNTSINDNKWHHIVGSRENDDFTLYLDGQLIERIEKEQYFENKSENLYNSALNENSNVDIGVYRPLSSPSAFFKGNIDEIGVYSRALTSSEILNLYEEQKAKRIEYVESHHGQASTFEKEHTIEIPTNSNYSTLFQNDFTVDLWFIPKGEKGSLFTYDNQINISYQLSTNEIILSDYNSQIITPFNFSQNHPNFLTITYNSSSNTLSIYNNEKKVGGSNSWSPSGSGGNTIIIGDGFEGNIDEVRIKNSTSSNSEVIKNYFNYQSDAKGCCNYLVPVNPAKTGFNSTTYNDTTAYSKTIFTKHYFDGKTMNLTLYNVSNITSQDTSKAHYNFLVDVCMILIYDIFSYDEGGNAAQDVKTGFDQGECKPLIRRGIY